LIVVVWGLETGSVSRVTGDRHTVLECNVVGPASLTMEFTFKGSSW